MGMKGANSINSSIVELSSEFFIDLQVHCDV